MLAYDLGTVTAECPDMRSSVPAAGQEQIHVMLLSEALLSI